MINLTKFLEDYGDDLQQFTIILLGEEIQVGKQDKTWKVEKVDNKHIWNRQNEFPYVAKDYSLIPSELDNIVRIEVPRYFVYEGGETEQPHSGTWVNYF